MPQNKDEYFAISEAKSLPARCPILERCERRAQTLAISNRWPLKEANERAGLISPIVRRRGEPVEMVGGDNNFIFSGQCPEVNLFETSYAIAGFSNCPTTKGEYDKFLEPKMQVLETAHFSTCPEYSAAAAQTMRPEVARSWIITNYQWLIATAIAIGSLAAGILALK